MTNSRNKKVIKREIVGEVTRMRLERSSESILKGQRNGSTLKGQYGYYEKNILKILSEKKEDKKNKRIINIENNDELL